MNHTRGLGSVFAATLFVLLSLDATIVRAHETNASLVPNPATAVNTEGRVRPCINCHNNPDGGAGCATPPCLNPFGMAFRANMFRWNAALAAMDSDGDGFTNGQELQDPLGSWMFGPMPGVPEYATPPGNPGVTPGDADVDGDDYCRFGFDMNGDGDCRDAGENDGSFDCNDMAMSVNSHATEVCSNVADDDCNGFPTLSDPVCSAIVDRDGDGRCTMGTDTNADRNCGGAGESSASVVDCDDTRANVYSGARENCSDTVDNDCDGDTDLADGQCQGDSDVDGDGYCPVGIDNNADGDCVDPGEVVTSIGDCDDENTAVGPGQTEVCSDALDNECDGAADLNDTDCRPVRDEDLDGVCPMGTDLDHDGDCNGTDEATGLVDCDDGNALRAPTLNEVCTDAERTDEDCDLLVNLADNSGETSNCLGYLDQDDDGYCFVGPDANRDGDCVDGAAEFGMATDCDETSAIAASVNPTATEICTDAVDNDCDGSQDEADPVCVAYRDADHDGFCTVGHDDTGDGDCADSGEQRAPFDADEGDPTVYPDAPENCIDGRDNDQDGPIDIADDECVSTLDADGDGACPLGLDMNGDGDCTDPGENATVSDCDDTNADIGPSASEATRALCDNHRDDDCDVDVDLFDADCFFVLDRDGDGFCGMGVDDNRDGDCTDEAEDRFGIDCDDTQSSVSPGRPEMCMNGIDDDCDGAVDTDDTICACTSAADCDDSDPCTVDTCLPAGMGCHYTRALTCIDGGMMPDAGIDGGAAPAPASGGCSVGRGHGGSLWVFALGGLFFLSSRRRRGARRSS